MGKGADQNRWEKGAEKFSVGGRAIVFFHSSVVGGSSIGVAGGL